MADTKATALSAFTPVLTDILYGVDDPGGTPVSGKVTLTSLRDLLQANLTKATIAAAANAEALVSTGYSLTGSNAQSLVDLAGTWNTTGTPTLLKFNVTDTASNAASKLLDLQVGGSSKVAVTKAGYIYVADAGRLVDPTGAYGFQPRTGGLTYIDSGTALVVRDVANLYRDLMRVTNDTLSIGQSGNCILARDAANTLALRNGANAQAFNVYNTYTDASNYERGFMKFSANTMYIGTEKAGTGSARGLNIQYDGSDKLLITSGIRVNTHLYCNTAGVWDVGSSALAFGNCYLDKSLYLKEMTAPSGVADRAIIFAQDNGAGKTQLMVQFGSGAAQQIAIEP